MRGGSPAAAVARANIGAGHYRQISLAPFACGLGRRTAAPLASLGWFGYWVGRGAGSGSSDFAAREYLARATGCRWAWPLPQDYYSVNVMVTVGGGICQTIATGAFLV